jgi:CheY-like chemotaxis protein
LRFNLKKSKNPPKSPTAAPYSSSSPLVSSIKNNLINNSFLTPIDILTVDKNSRLTLTKKLKKFIPLNPEDNIIVYQDTYNKTIVLKVQQEETIVDNWILIRTKDNTVKPNTINDAISKNETYNDNALVNGYGIDDEDESDVDNNLWASVENVTPNKQKADTLYSTPILLIDDEKDILIALNTILKSEGYRNVKAFSDSRDMLRHLIGMKKTFYYRLAVIDIRMPDINGIQIHKISRILNPSIKTIFLTALDAVDELTSLISEIKPADIMRKPVDQNTFIKTVNDKVVSIGLP